MDQNKYNTKPCQDEKSKSQFGLLTVRRFAPFFWTQFLGAFNDNLFKNALMIFMAYKAGQSLNMEPSIMLNFAAGLFILPFFLFSGIAGQIADGFEKSNLIRKVKLIEIGIMTLVPIAFYINNIWLLLGVLFLMGTQSTFFGPIKYSIMPQHLARTEIIGGNAMVEMGTFLAILLGTIAGGVLIQGEDGPMVVGAGAVLTAVVGWLASRFIPEAKSAVSNGKISYNPIKETLVSLKLAKEVKSVFLSILAISWFWFLGGSYITQFPTFAAEVLHGSGSVVTLLLAMFSVGVGGGSILCEALSGRKVELGLVPLGAIGLSVFGFDLAATTIAPPAAGLMSVGEFLQVDGSLRVLADLILIGVFGGVYIVPLFAFIQTRTESSKRARVIAANNIINALFMVVAAILGAILFGWADLTVTQFFAVLAGLNILVTAYIFTVIPEFVLRFLVWILTSTMYRVRKRNLDVVPDEGPAVLVCNHVSYIDGLIIGGALRRPIRFVVWEPIYRLPILNIFFRLNNAIPIHSAKKKPEVFKKAFEEITKTLKEGDVVCIFPEGRLTRDGQIDEFRPGIEKIIQDNPVPVIPMALKGLWGSVFSHKDGDALTRWPKRFWSRISLIAGQPVQPEDVKAEDLREQVLDLKKVA